jgi:hypothetical protein
LLSSPEPEIAIPAKGPVHCIEISGNDMMWSDDEPIEGDLPGVPVGVVHLLNQTNMSTIPIKVSTDCFDV